MSCKVVIKQEEVDVDVDTINITSDSSYGQVIDFLFFVFIHSYYLQIWCHKRFVRVFDK